MGKKKSSQEVWDKIVKNSVYPISTSSVSLLGLLYDEDLAKKIAETSRLNLRMTIMNINKTKTVL